MQNDRPDALTLKHDLSAKTLGSNHQKLLELKGEQALMADASADQLTREFKVLSMLCTSEAHEQALTGMSPQQLPQNRYSDVLPCKLS